MAICYCKQDKTCSVICAGASHSYSQIMCMSHEGLTMKLFYVDVLMSVHFDVILGRLYLGHLAACGHVTVGQGCVPWRQRNISISSVGHVLL